MTQKEKNRINRFVEEFAIKILDGNASLFIGSGFSREAKLPLWSELLENFAEEINLKVTEERHDLISLAQYYVNAKKRTKLNHEINMRFSYSKMKPSVPLTNHDILAALPIKNIWTTNYDQLLEETLKQHNIIPICLTNDKTIKKINSKNSVVIHKIHGDADSPEDCVITKADYDLYSNTHEMLLAKLKAEMCYNTFLFLGYSFSDTNIQHILSRIRAIYGGNDFDVLSPNKHYCIFAKNKKNPNNKNYDYKYDNIRLKHHIADLQSYGIETLLLDDYAEMTDILMRVRNRVCKKNVFISGSYPDTLSEKEKQLIRDTTTAITAVLVANNYSVYSGYGENLGADVVLGAHNGCELPAPPGHLKEIKWLNDHLFIFPFPYKGTFSTDEERHSRYSTWRRNIIEKTHITIIISGMKKNEDTGKIEIAEGVREEYEISKNQNNLIIPLEFFEGMSKEIWHEMENKAINGSYPKSEFFKKLKERNNIDDNIIKIIERFA